MERFNSKHLHLREFGDALELIFRPSIELTGGSASRAHHVIKRARRLIRREQWQTKIRDGQLEAKIPSTDIAQLIEAAAAVDAMLDHIAVRPLEPYEVEEALDITSKELKRWTKAGLLPISGQGSFRKGQRIFYNRYSASGIAELAANPDIIRRWREADTPHPGK
jgi:hypothetical protein